MRASSFYRKIEHEGKTYYIDISEVGIADHVYVDTKDPHSNGFGGSTIEFKHRHGTDRVKGPWHTGVNQIGELNLRYLHRTRVTLLNEDDEVMYAETDYVLGPFMRGEIIAHQLANALNVPIRVHSESNGGSSTSTVMPKTLMHPMAYEDLGQPRPSNESYRENFARQLELGRNRDHNKKV